MTQNEKMMLSTIIEEIRINTSEELAQKTEKSIKTILRELTSLLIESKNENEMLRKEISLLEGKLSVLNQDI